MIKNKCLAWLILFAPLYFMQSAAAQLPDFTKLVKKYGAAVVNISTTQKAREIPYDQLEGLQMPEGAPLDDLLRRFFGEQGKRSRPREAKSLGSGFIISGDGYILTNHHVVKNADEIIVRLSDRRELEAKLIGSDKRSDIALLKVDTEDLPVVEIGSGNDLEVGEWVLAIGSPFGFDHSVTAGIVSAKGRSLPSDNYVPFIQTDVAINPGNSGGPLFNMDGEVVGVNSQIYSRTGGFMGLSFAIPMDVAINVAEQLKIHGHVTRGWLGVQVQDVTRELAESFGMNRPHGALISKVLPDSPAASAGFQIGDVIIEYDNQKVETSSALPPLVGMTTIGDRVKVKVIRQGHSKKLAVKIGQLPDDLESQLGAIPSEGKTIKRFGLVVSDLSQEQREQLQVIKNGVLVRKVLVGPAGQAGIQKGDVILRIRNKVVHDSNDFEEIANELPNKKSVAILAQRRGSPIWLSIRLDD